MIAAAYLVLSITILISQTQGAQLPECTSNGFFRHPDDCTRFYRCVDLTGRGYFQTYTFSCPVGTVFDETVSVCNHPWAAPPCEEAEAETTTKMEEEIFEETDEDSEDVRYFLLVSVLISNSTFWILTFHKHNVQLQNLIIKGNHLLKNILYVGQNVTVTYIKNCHRKPKWFPELQFLSFL